MNIFRANNEIPFLITHQTEELRFIYQIVHLAKIYSSNVWIDITIVDFAKNN
jgi:hypothetical protein